MDVSVDYEYRRVLVRLRWRRRRAISEYFTLSGRYRDHRHLLKPVNKLAVKLNMPTYGIVDLRLYYLNAPTTHIERPAGPRTRQNGGKP